MNIASYLSRINYTHPLRPDRETLNLLHRHHVFSVPFENIDVHYKILFDIEPANVYDKVVNRRRGGFCYEVNSLFNDLLRSIGFETKIISAKVITDFGVPGPEYDHLALIVTIDSKQYIADVGFGDLFVEPLEITTDLQHDGRNYFRIEYEDGEYSLYMSDDQIHFQKKYTFSPDETPIELFRKPCYEKQVNPDSHFVINTICTLPTESGRITIYNDKFTETVGSEKKQTIIKDDNELRSILLNRFGISIPRLPIELNSLPSRQ